MSDVNSPKFSAEFIAAAVQKLQGYYQMYYMQVMCYLTENDQKTAEWQTVTNLILIELVTVQTHE